VRRRRTRSSRLPLVMAGVLAVAAAFLSHIYLTQARVAGATSGPEVSVVAATVPVARGTRLVAAFLELARLPARYAPPGALRDISAAAGRVTLADLAPGEVVTQTRLARVRAGPVASLVPRGLRAFAVPTSLPPGALVPGDLVDVLATYAGAQPHAEVVVDGVEVLFALGPSGPGAESGGLGLDLAAAGAQAPTTLILLVSPDQEERLAFARAFASLEVAIASAE
jgi:pilus assembly protein CpaB